MFPDEYQDAPLSVGLRECTQQVEWPLPRLQLRAEQNHDVVVRHVPGFADRLAIRLTVAPNSGSCTGWAPPRLQ
jgi:hypothetical protein